MEFVALDVETANHVPSSICAIAVASQDGTERTWRVRPEPFRFEQQHQRLHGITAASVTHAPRFDAVWPEVASRLEGRVVIAHNASFDTTAILSACRTSELLAPACEVLCSLRLARAVWPGLPSHSLDSLARHLGIPLQHHDVASDARAVAMVVQRAMLECGAVTLTALLARHDIRCEPLVQRRREEPTAEGDPPRPHCRDFRGKRVAFTGSMLSLTRKDAERLVSEYGGKATNSVSKKLDFLVVGGGGGAGEKLDRTRDLVARGAQIKILTEDDFVDAFSSETTKTVVNALHRREQRSYGGADCAIDMGDVLAALASRDPDVAALLAAEEARLADLAPEEKRALEASVLAEEQAADEARLAQEQREGEIQERVQAARDAGLIGTLTEVGRAYGISAIRVGRILDELRLREYLDFDAGDGLGERRMLRGVPEGYAVCNPWGATYWIAEKIAPLLEPHARTPRRG